MSAPSAHIYCTLLLLEESRLTTETFTIVFSNLQNEEEVTATISPVQGDAKILSSKDMESAQ